MVGERKARFLIGGSDTFRSLRAVILGGLLIGVATVGLAQVGRSALTGTTSDSSGRLLGGTHITAVQTDTDLRRETTSDAKGNYEIPELPVGAYAITFEHSGFKRITFDAVEQVIGRTRTPLG